MKSTSTDERPLSGILVVELAHMIAAPSAAMALHELGAEVIKIEPGDGDRSRALTRRGVFASHNRGKRSVVLDLKSDAGRKAARDILQHADVFIEANRPGVVERLGLSYKEMSALNPRLVYVSLSAFNKGGPDADRAGLDAVIQAESGLMSITGPLGGPPVKVGTQVVDAATGVTIVASVMTALFQRSRTGRGQYVETSLFDVAIYLQGSAYADYFISGVEPGPQGNTTGFGYPTDVFPCTDGFLQASAYFEDRWIALCELLGVPDLASDPRFSTNEKRLENSRELFALLSEQFSTRSKADLKAMLVARNVPTGDVRSYSEIVERLASTAACPFADVEEPGAKVARQPYSGSEFNMRHTSKLAPTLGEHTDEVLAELAAGRLRDRSTVER